MTKRLTHITLAIAIAIMAALGIQPAHSANTFTTASGVLIPPSRGGTGVSNSDSATLTRSGAHALTITTTGTTNVTLPTSGTLAIVGANTFTSAQTAPAFIPNGATVPTNGLFLSAANTLGFATNSTERWVINASGAFNPTVDNTYDIGGTTKPRDINAARAVTAPTFKSASGSTSADTATPTTIFALPAAAGVYIVQAWLSGTTASVFGITAIIKHNGDNTAVQLTEIGTSSNIDLAMSSANVQVTQTAGTTQTVQWVYTVIGQ